MNRFTNEQMADMHLVYGEAQRNSREAILRIYTDRFPDRIVPNSWQFTAIYQRLCETGTLTDARPNARRERIGLEQNQRILDYFNQHTTASYRSAVAALGAVNHVVFIHLDIRGCKA